MVFRQFNLLFIVACGLSACAVGPALGQFVELNNGIDRLTDGHLRVNPDAFGSWTATGFGGEGDEYNPPGGGPQLRPKPVMFSNGFFLFQGGNQRELLSEAADWQQTGTPDFGADTSLDREITSANTVNAGVATSSFRVFDPAGGGFDVGFDLEQSITQVGTSDISFLSQTYTMTNNSTEAVSFQLVRASDADLAFGPGGSSGDDEVGTNTNTGDPPGVTSVWQQDYNTVAPPVPPEVSRITMSGENNGGAYYGGLQNDDPGGAGLPFGFGTDVQVWDAFGVPTNWRNYVSNVGYDTDGGSGQGAGQDGFVGLEFLVDLAASATDSLTLVTTYGAEAEATVSGDFNGDGAWDCTDINMLTAAVADGMDDPAFDMNGDGVVDGISDPADVDNDLVAWLERAGTEDTQGVTLGNPFLVGDANLDGTNDGQDFIQWNNGKFTSDTRWCGSNDADMVGGNFNGDTAIDGLDFILWNAFKFTSSMDLAAVPEPSAAALLAMLMGLGAVARTRRGGRA